MVKLIALSIFISTSLMVVAKDGESAGPTVEIYAVTRDLVDIASSQVIGVDARDQERVSIVTYRKGELIRKGLRLDRDTVGKRQKISEGSDPLFGTSDTVLVFWNNDKNPLLVRVEYGRPRLQVLHCSRVTDECFVARRYAQTLVSEEIWKVLWDVINLKGGAE